MRHQTYFHPLGAKNYEKLNVFLRLNRVEYHGISMHGICVSNSNDLVYLPWPLTNYPQCIWKLRSRKGLFLIFEYLAFSIQLVSLMKGRPQSMLWVMTKKLDFLQKALSFPTIQNTTFKFKTNKFIASSCFYVIQSVRKGGLVVVQQIVFFFCLIADAVNSDANDELKMFQKDTA